MAAGAAWRLRGGVLSVSLPAWTKTRMSHAAPSCVCTGTVHGAGLIGRTAAPCGVVWLVASRVAVWGRQGPSFVSSHIGKGLIHYSYRPPSVTRVRGGLRGVMRSPESGVESGDRGARGTGHAGIRIVRAHGPHGQTPQESDTLCASYFVV